MPATHHLARVTGGDVVAVHEVETRHVRDVVPQRVVDGAAHFVPAHVRDFEVLAIFMQVFAEELHLPWKQANAVDTAVLFTAVEQGLHAHADTEEGAVLADFAHQAIKAQATDLGHAIANRADAGEHHTVGFANHVGIAGDQHLAGAYMLKGLGHRVQVTHAVIDNRDRLHYRTPLVDGICPPMRSSTSTAMRSARPKALNTVSIWW